MMQSFNESGEKTGIAVPGDRQTSQTLDNVKKTEGESHPIVNCTDFLLQESLFGSQRFYSCNLSLSLSREE